jgi:hypothetical protein
MRRQLRGVVRPGLTRARGGLSQSLAERLGGLARSAILARCSLDLSQRGLAARKAEPGVEVAEGNADLRRAWARAHVVTPALVSWAALVLAEVVAVQAVRAGIGGLACPDRVLVVTVACEAFDRHRGPAGVCLTACTGRHARACQPAQERRPAASVAIRSPRDALAIARNSYTGAGIGGRGLGLSHGRLRTAISECRVWRSTVDPYGRLGPAIARCSVYEAPVFLLARPIATALTAAGPQYSHAERRTEAGPSNQKS